MSSPDEWTWTILTTGTTQKKQRCSLKGGHFLNKFIGPVGQTFARAGATDNEMDTAVLDF